jgi:hypothetical protein
MFGTYGEAHIIFVPHDKIEDVILRIEKLKEANANSSLFLPSWVKDEYFVHLYTATPTMWNKMETNTESEMEEVDNAENKEMAIQSTANTDHKETVEAEGKSYQPQENGGADGRQ